MLGTADGRRTADAGAAADGAAECAHARRGRRALGLALAALLACLLFAASASAACKRPPNAVWNGTVSGPLQTATFESSVTDSETYPGSEVLNISGRTHSTGKFLFYPVTLSGTFSGTVACSGAEHFQAVVSGLIGTGPEAEKVENLVVNYVGNANYTEASGTYESSIGESGTWTAALYASAGSQGTQPGEVELINPSTTLATAFSAQPAQPGLPAGLVAPVGVVSYEVTNVAPESTISVTFKLPPGSEPTGAYKLIEGEYIQYPASKTKINGEQVTLEITDNGPWDEDPTPGVIRDPLVPVQSQVGSPPEVRVDGESGVTQTAATLEGEVNPEGGEVSSCQFEYGTTTSYGSVAACSPTPGSGNGAERVSAALTGLAANTTYHYRLVASNPGGTTDSRDEAFKTLPEAPAVETGEASSITQTSATLSATVNPNGGEIEQCYFSASGHSELSEEECESDPGSGTEPVTVSVKLGELYPDTEYHYWIYAENEGGVSSGHELTFTTLPYHTPEIALQATEAITQSSATVNATVDRNGEPLEECNVEWGTSEGAYEAGTECSPTPGAGTGPEPVTGSLTGLEPGTTYHYRVSTGFLGIDAHSSDGTFTTLAYIPPTVLTGAASSVTQTSATLNGSVNPNGEPVEACRVEYRTGETASSTECEPAPGSGTSPVAVSIGAVGLQPNTAYSYRVVVTGLEGRTYEGGEETFTTLPEPPTATTGNATSVTPTSATLNATVNPNGGEVTACTLEYGTSPAYGHSAACSPSPGSGTSSVAVSAAVGGLSGGTLYHFRVVATNAGGTRGGADATLTTPASGPAPAVRKMRPKKGPTTGGTLVTIVGTGFTGVTAVRFGSTAGTITSSSATSITVETPAEEAGTAPVTVTTPNGTSAVTAGGVFTYKAPKVKKQKRAGRRGSRVRSRRR